jgi:hypothetical protein
MTTSAAGTDSRNFVEFYREYAQSWVHTTTAAALTGFIGLASFISPWFLAVAIAVYVLPPIYIYLNEDVDPIPDSETSADREVREPGSESTGRDSAVKTDSSETDSATVSNRDESDSRTAATVGNSDDDSVRPGANQVKVLETPRGDHTESENGSDTATEEMDPEADTGPDAEADSNPDATLTDERARNPEPATTAADGEDGIDDSTRSDTEAVGEAEPGSDHTKADTSAEAETGPGTETDSGTGTEETESEVDADIQFEAEWTAVDSPVDVALRDAVASGDGAYAAGDGGVVLAYREEWAVLLDDGPAGDSNTLWGIDCTANTDGEGDDGGNGGGEVLWVAGDSGAVGRYDPAAGGIADFSAPKDQTSSWTGLAVTGPVGKETVHLANGSGAVIRGGYDEAEGAIEWGELDKPGSGSSITAITFRDRNVGYLCDSSGGVYRTEDGGGSYETIGPDEAGVAFRNLAPVGSEGLSVAGEDGSLFQYDGSAWTRRSVSEVPLRAIDTTGSDSIDLQGVAGDGAGTIYEYDGDEWTPTETAVGSIATVAIEDNALAIGDGGGILERERTRES